jgi:hypothetical protein
MEDLMSADGKRLQGEVAEKPQLSSGDVERLIQGFLRALLAEQGEASKAKQSPGASQ